MEEPDYAPDYEHEPHDDEDGGMHPLLRALGINALIALGVTGLMVLLNGQDEGLVVAGITMMGQACVNVLAFIILLIKGDKAWALGCLLSALILAIVGFSTCLMGFTY